MNMTRAFYELKDAVVGIAGLGGLGSNVATALTRLGVGKLILVDFDSVEYSNLNRQQYTMDQVGMFKTEALIENLKKINHLDIVLETVNTRLTHENIPDVFAGADLVAECFDRAEQKQMIAETVLSKLPGAFLVTASGLAGYGDSNSVSTTRISDRHYLVGDMTSGIGRGIVLTAPRVGLVAYHQANIIAELLINNRHNLTPRHNYDYQI